MLGGGKVKGGGKETMEWDVSEEWVLTFVGKPVVVGRGEGVEREAFGLEGKGLGDVAGPAVINGHLVGGIAWEVHAGGGGVVVEVDLGWLGGFEGVVEVGVNNFRQGVPTGHGAVAGSAVCGRRSRVIWQGNLVRLTFNGYFKL